MKIKKRTLLLLAAIVWMIAGFNILRIGIETYAAYKSVINFILSLLVFLFFWFMIFYKLTVKHTDRIQNYQEERQFFLNFFDLKSFLIMAFMITFGITIRTFHLLPDRFIAVFYTGLGAALFLAGITFGRNYIFFKKNRNYKLAFSHIIFLLGGSILYEHRKAHTHYHSENINDRFYHLFFLLHGRRGFLPRIYKTL